MEKSYTSWKLTFLCNHSFKICPTIFIVILVFEEFNALCQTHYYIFMSLIRVFKWWKRQGWAG